MAGIYVHIPFCSQACHYCDFHFSTSLKYKQRIINAINKELIMQKHYLKSQLIQTIYFGGGTPSLIDSMSLELILETIHHNYKLMQNTEITIEANPEDINQETILSWSTMGFNRVSLGVQSFRDQDLKYMNRIHNSTQARHAIRLLQESAINNLNVDLIYGYPELDNFAWKSNLDAVLSLKVPHLSCYCMTIEPKTPLYDFIKKGKHKQLNSGQGNAQFLIARKKLISSGYEHYEISNFSKPGYKSLHNNNYWNKTHYLGVGPSAHSFNGISRQWNIKNNHLYCKKIEDNDSYYEVEILNNKNQINEYILTHIRTSIGMDTNYFKQNMSDVDYVNFTIAISKLEAQKLLKINDNSIVLTESGMLISDSISENLFLI
tara:strand:- start:842 stop:1969 length:1128 start_codon:yes stop_codon:yes gene_type:complete